MPAPARVHPTAVISPQAEIAPDVEIGPYVVIDGAVRLGVGTVVRPHAHLIGPMTIGCHNDIGTGVVLGDRPQHLLYAGQPTGIEIGDGNVFREHVTIHRGYTGTTVVGHRNYLMASAHVAHDCRVGDHCLLANGALVGGHCIVADRVLLSGNCAVHQWSRVGRLALLSGATAATKDIPPFFVMVQRDMLAGVNVIGMRRAGLSGPQIQAVRKAYRMLARPGVMMRVSIGEIEAELGRIDVIQELLTFIRESKRGICGSHRMGVRPNEEAA